MSSYPVDSDNKNSKTIKCKLCGDIILEPKMAKLVKKDVCHHYIFIIIELNMCR